MSIKLPRPLFTSLTQNLIPTTSVLSYTFHLKQVAFTAFEKPGLEVMRKPYDAPLNSKLPSTSKKRPSHNITS